MKSIHTLVLLCLAVLGCRAATTEHLAQPTHVPLPTDIVVGLSETVDPCDDCTRLELAWELLLRGDHATARELAQATRDANAADSLHATRAADLLHAIDCVAAIAEGRADAALAAHDHLKDSALQRVLGAELDRLILGDAQN